MMEELEQFLLQLSYQEAGNWYALQADDILNVEDDE